MDGRRSPSDPKPPTQTTAANRENGVQRNKNTAEDVNTSKSCGALCEWSQNILHKVGEWTETVGGKSDISAAKSQKM